MRLFFLILFFVLNFAISVFTQSYHNPYKSIDELAYQEGDSILCPRLLFGFSGQSVISETIDSLEIIGNFLNENKSLIVEIGIHSDSRGNHEYNKRLTGRRAIEVRLYLIEKYNIQPERIHAKGYGESVLIVSDEVISNLKTDRERELAHQINRRTVLKIIEIRDF